MSPLFGGKEVDQHAANTTTADIDRADALPLPQLGAEVMNKGFSADGPGGPGKPGTLEDLSGASFARVDVVDIAREFSSAYSSRSVGPELTRQLGYILAEGLQALENAGLAE